jgi:hypothetical protein
VVSEHKFVFAHVFAIDSLRFSYWFCASFVLKFDILQGWQKLQVLIVLIHFHYLHSKEEIITLRDLMKEMYEDRTLPLKSS